MIIFVQKSALIYAAKRMADEHKTIYAIKDENAFESALKRAENRLFYDKTADLFDLAAEYAFGFVKNHPFCDGNKRLAYIACRLFLLLNGQDFELSEDEKYQAIINLAVSRLTKDGFAGLIREKDKNETV
ncbi:MAG: type II toxin-antitoxin system death-on-curing family toxin [Acetobacter sp.]|nr:type II toxin-antitoxin system death-on-curing family toxin [Acetobacter sp.]